MTIPLNGSGVINRIHKAMQKSNYNQGVRPAQGLVDAIRSTSEQIAESNKIQEEVPSAESQSDVSTDQAETTSATDQRDKDTPEINDQDKLKFLTTAGVPSHKADQAVSLLQGVTEEELTESAALIAGLFEQDQTENGITGTGFGLNDSEPVRQRAVDPTQGMGSRNPLPKREDPLLAGFRHVLKF